MNNPTWNYTNVTDNTTVMDPPNNTASLRKIYFYPNATNIGGRYIF